MVDALAAIENFDNWRIELRGVALTANHAGVLLVDDDRTLVVADLHLEKGTARARQRSFLPPYDTRTTLARLKRAIDGLRPARVIALGDSFHDVGGCERLHPDDRANLLGLQKGRQWLWIAGNHDPVLPPDLGGDRSASHAIGALTFRHEPTRGGGSEIAGHLHPCARVARGGHVQRRPCFIVSAERLLLPAFGAYTGGLNVLDPAVAGLFDAGPAVAVLGRSGVYPVAIRQLRGDVEKPQLRRNSMVARNPKARAMATDSSPYQNG